METFQKEAPPARTLLDWKNRLLEALSVLPRTSTGDQSRRRISEEKQQEIVEAFGDTLRMSLKEAALKLNFSQPIPVSYTHLTLPTIYSV